MFLHCFTKDLDYIRFFCWLLLLNVASFRRSCFSLRSLPFVVDAAPTPGVVVAIPQEGEALKTQFTFSTSGWTDEETEVLVELSIFRWRGRKYGEGR